MTEPFTELDDNGLKDVSRIDEIEARLSEKLQANNMDDADLRLAMKALRQLGAAVIAYRDKDVFEVPKPDEDVLDLIGLVEDAGSLPFTAAKFGPS